MLGDNLNGGMFFDQSWRNHSIPYEILGDLYIRNNDETKAFSTWEIEAGATLLIHENRNLAIGSLYGDARLLALGTTTTPITRVDDQASQWGQISFSNSSKADSELRWVPLLYGGGEANADQNYGVLNQRGGGTLTLANVTIKHSSNAALYAGSNADKGGFQITDSRFELNRLGLSLWDARGNVRNSQFINNSEGALINHRASSICIDAAGNWWGAASGKTNNGIIGVVSDGVIYWPWLQNQDGIPQDRSSISPGDKFSIIADGQDAGRLTVTLRDANGQALSGKEVRLESTRGTLSQPAAPTDALGQTTATITSTETGEATITDFNLTDNTPLETQATIVFWQGPGDTGGLVEPSGVPYARPELVVEGEPFQMGFPVLFRLPMQNANASPVAVEVTYKVSNFGIGQTWTPVTTLSNTLAASALWDAPGGFTVPDTMHHCVAYDVQYTTESTQRMPLQSGSFSGQRNLSDASPPPSPPQMTAIQMLQSLSRGGAVLAG